MKKLIFLFPLAIVLYHLITMSSTAQKVNLINQDSLMIVKMVEQREAAMQKKDIQKVVAQFRDDATFINGGGWYFKNKSEIEAFHKAISQTKPGYTSAYKAGKITIQLLSPQFALAYYPWQVTTIKTSAPADTLIGTGLMTLLAQKDKESWKWKAVTNQQTKEYFDDLKTHTVKFNPE